MKRYLCTSMLCICCALAVCAQASQPRQEEDVVYLKDGGVLRGDIVKRTAKDGRIRLRDGSVFVYKKSQVKMIAKEPLPLSEKSAKEDSLQVVRIIEKVLAEESEKRRMEEEMKAFQQALDGGLDANNQQLGDEEAEGVRLYSMVDVMLGLGFGDLPAPKGQKTVGANATANTNKFTAVRYAVGGRGKHFGMGLSLGIQQLYPTGNTYGMPADSSGNVRYVSDSIPSNLLFMPLGLDMHLDFSPKSAASFFIASNAAYAVSLNSNSNVKGHFIINPAIGLRFGRTVSSLLSAGFQFHIAEDGRKMDFFTIRFGLIF